jgi:hypothetical protein
MNEIHILFATKNGLNRKTIQKLIRYENTMKKFTNLKNIETEKQNKWASLTYTKKKPRKMLKRIDRNI